MIDAWRLSVGTLTAIPVRPPSGVDARTAAGSLLLGPLAVVPLAAAVGLVTWGGRELALAPLAVALVALAALALGSRAFHLDGLADTADGLTASYDRERSLAVMRTGDVGPAGAATLVLVLGTQAAALAVLDPWLAAAAVLVSRGTLTLGCLRGVPGARPEGLGATHAGTVPRAAAAVQWTVLAALLVGAAVLADLDWWRALVAVAAAVGVVALLLRRAVRRLGGTTGDVLGASVELGLAVLLLALT